MTFLKVAYFILKEKISLSSAKKILTARDGFSGSYKKIDDSYYRENIDFQ